MCRSTARLTSCLLVVLLTVKLVVIEALHLDEDDESGHKARQGADWHYHEQNQWADRFKTCALRAQSPIDIQMKYVIFNSQLNLNFFNYKKPIKFKLENAHHTIKLSPLENMSIVGQAPDQPLKKILLGNKEQQLSTLQDPRPSKESFIDSDNEFIAVDNRLRNNQMNRSPAASGEHTESSNSLDQDHQQADIQYSGRPAIKLDWLDDGNNEYILHDIHFHWGERRDNGSEHAIDGRRAAMEMHLVHIKRGLDRSQVGFTSDSLAVIAVLIESHRKSNADFNPMVNELTGVNMTSKTREVEFKGVASLLPSNLESFYTYSGSLTTPPCYQVVNWIVMTERLNMNAKQIEMFRNLYAPKLLRDDHENDGHGSDAYLMVPNIRALQQLNNRTILASAPRWLKILGNSASRSRNLLGYFSYSGFLSILISICCLTLSMQRTRSVRLVHS